jgi:hypothetical protein
LRKMDSGVARPSGKSHSRPCLIVIARLRQTRFCDD